MEILIVLTSICHRLVPGRRCSIPVGLGLVAAARSVDIEELELVERSAHGILVVRTRGPDDLVDRAL